ncbi:MAG: 1-deoxy-D-xylulose-5-phosphate reductoisomerase, partial [Zoogloeaceae bacterium]|nr:1-deoxy-D-xylulose-5-phosphate reductoisomerase [Zoogloeaceae bacterium]
MKPQNLVLLGATGSIGQSTLSVIRLHPERYRALALCAHRNVELLLAQCREFKPRYAVLGTQARADELAGRLKAEGIATEVLHGEVALKQMVALPEADAVVAAIVGAAGLPPALAAAQAGKKVLLANKESLVMAGGLFMRTARENGATILPVDSEHNAIFQSLPREFAHDPQAGIAPLGVKKLWLTASGGPFLRHSAEAIAQAGPAQALAHPNWTMGKKVSVDSASLMNKGLEVIEAHWLFSAPPEQIEVVVHPQSIVHSLVEYADGSFLAQLGTPDMRVPIAHALAFPERFASGVKALDLFALANLSFERPDRQRFPCLQLAFEALKTGGTAPAILNAANEVAVAAFLAEKIPFGDIARINAETLAQTPATPADTLEAILSADQ